ncbi:hypothetical protein JXI42_08635 [bacterium]|nr:hypothetical protein [bacterium]
MSKTTKIKALSENSEINTIPPSVLKLFWDVNKETVDPVEHAVFIIKRVLNWGDQTSLKWLRTTYSEKQILEVIKRKRGLLPKTINFWEVYYGMAQRSNS